MVVLEQVQKVRESLKWRRHEVQSEEHWCRLVEGYMDGLDDVLVGDNRRRVRADRMRVRREYERLQRQYEELYSMGEEFVDSVDDVGLQEMLRLRYLEGLSAQKVAEHVGCEVQNVYQRIARVKNHHA